MLAELRLRLGQVLADRDPPAAIAEIRVAHLIWERLGSPESARSAQLLNKLGLQATSTPRAVDATSVLSPRERVVLQRLRAGRSNAEIAAELHNSVRTIEHHVSSILTELGRVANYFEDGQRRVSSSSLLTSLALLRRYRAQPATQALALGLGTAVALRAEGWWQLKRHVPARQVVHRQVVLERRPR